MEDAHLLGLRLHACSPVSRTWKQQVSSAPCWKVQRTVKIIGDPLVLHRHPSPPFKFEHMTFTQHTKHTCAHLEMSPQHGALVDRHGTLPVSRRGHGSVGTRQQESSGLSPAVMLGAVAPPSGTIQPKNDLYALLTQI